MSILILLLYIERRMNLNIKLIALDMDGTLLDSDKEITPRTIEALRKAHESGAEIAICTGRVVQGIRRYLPDLPFVRYVITSNGASIYDLQEKKNIYEHLIPVEKALKVLNSYKTSGGLLEVYADNVSYMNMVDYADLPGRYGVSHRVNNYLREKNEPVESIVELIRSHYNGVEKFNLSHFPAVSYSRIWNKLNTIGGLQLTYSDTINIEVGVYGCSKGVALTALAEHIGCSMDEVMCFGDSHNDREMLLAAGHPVVMGNAEEAIKTLTSNVIGTNDEEGIAVYLESIY